MEYQPVSATVAPLIVELPAELDATNCDGVASELTAACKPGVAAVIADLTQTTFCDSSGVRTLLQAHKRAADLGIGFEVAVSSPSVLRVLELTGLTSILSICPSVEEAVNTGYRELA